METDAWRKSSYSTDTGACVEVFWRKSTRSGPYTDNCVEVAFMGDGEVLVRDTKDKEAGPILRFAGPEWAAFVADTKDGKFDIA
jgi:hypothetical protein